jgi:hypothetical protein
VDFALPAGPGTHTFSVTTLAGTQTATTTVPDPAAPTTPAPAPTPTTAPSGPALGVLRVARVERVARHRFRLDVACDGAAACAGKVVVRSKRAVRTARGTLRRVVVARTAYTVEPGTTDRVVLEVRRHARPALRVKRLRVVAVQRAAGAHAVRTGFWLERR